MVRSSLKFVEEVQEAKQIDDLMGRIDKLMGGNTEAEQAGIHRFIIKLFSSAIVYQRTGACFSQIPVTLRALSDIFLG